MARVGAGRYRPVWIDGRSCPDPARCRQHPPANRGPTCAALAADGTGTARYATTSNPAAIGHDRTGQGFSLRW